MTSTDTSRASSDEFFDAEAGVLQHNDSEDVRCTSDPYAMATTSHATAAELLLPTERGDSVTPIMQQSSPRPSTASSGGELSRRRRLDEMRRNFDREFRVVTQQREPTPISATEVVHTDNHSLSSWGMQQLMNDVASADGAHSPPLSDIENRRTSSSKHSSNEPPGSHSASATSSKSATLDCDRSGDKVTAQEKSRSLDRALQERQSNDEPRAPINLPDDVFVAAPYGPVSPSHVAKTLSLGRSNLPPLTTVPRTSSGGDSAAILSCDMATDAAEQLVEQLVTSELELAVKSDGDSNIEAAKEQCEVRKSAAPDNTEAPKPAQEEASSNAQIISNQYVDNDDLPPPSTAPRPPPRRRRSLRTIPSSEDAPSCSSKLPIEEESPQVAKESKESTPKRPQTLQCTLTEDEYTRSSTARNLDTGELHDLNTLPESGLVTDPIGSELARRFSLQRAATLDTTRSSTNRSFEDEHTHSGLTNTLARPRATLSRFGRRTVQYASTKSKSFKVIMNNAVGKVVTKTRTAAHDLANKFREAPTVESDDSGNSDDDNDGTASTISTGRLVRARHHKKGPFDFEQLRKVQDLSGEHSGAVWSMRWSTCGQLLATAGYDGIIRIWVLRDQQRHFAHMRDKYKRDVDMTDDAFMARQFAQRRPDMSSALSNNYRHDTPSPPTGSSASNFRSRPYRARRPSGDSEASSSASLTTTPSVASSLTTRRSSRIDDAAAPFAQQPLCTYRGHSGAILDLAWSKNYFILSASMDKTVRLWHISRAECLCVFQHLDFVTGITFLPKDDRFFLSGSLDGKLRLWHIPDKKVALWNEVEGSCKLITALAMVRNGKFAVVGTFDGRCVLYATEQLRYHTMINVGGKHKGKRKITGLAVCDNRLLVTSNDSRIRMYDLRDLSLTCKYKGIQNGTSQMFATFSPTGKHIVCGSEDSYIYLWRTSADQLPYAVRNDRNSAWERIRAHHSTTTAAIFALRPDLLFEQFERARGRALTPLQAKTTVYPDATPASLTQHITRPSTLSRGAMSDSQQVLSPGGEAFTATIVDDKTSTLASQTPSASAVPPALLNAATATRRNVSTLRPNTQGDYLITADFNGNIFVFMNRARLRTTGHSQFFGELQ